GPRPARPDPGAVAAAQVINAGRLVGGAGGHLGIFLRPNGGEGSQVGRACPAFFLGRGKGSVFCGFVGNLFAVLYLCIRSAEAGFKAVLSADLDFLFFPFSRETHDIPWFGLVRFRVRQETGKLWSPLCLLW
ncbi:MAG: hypothetical protein LBR12_04430, partial [Opitutaceae bacterium]|nr:hypothetical protein [Opitutaceae bacterium]